MNTLKQRFQEQNPPFQDFVIEGQIIPIIKEWLTQKRQQYKGEITKATIDELLEELNQP